jgi:hypothetical protein
MDPFIGTLFFFAGTGAVIEINYDYQPVLLFTNCQYHTARLLLNILSQPTLFYQLIF